MNKISSYSKDLFAAGSFAAAAALTSFLASSSLDKDLDYAIIKNLPLPHSLSHASAAKHPYNYLATKPHTTSCEIMNKSLNNQTNNAASNRTILECDYAIIGHGKAGQSAVRMLQKLEPDANIIVIDPTDIHINSQNQPTTKRSRGSINLLKTHASYIDHSNKMIRLHANPLLTEQDSSPGVHFHKSALIATGSRGAPPPHECISKEACERVLELRSTSLPPTQTSSIKQQHGQDMAFPTLDPRTVRSLSFLAASQSATVAIMGSGFEALEMAASLSRLQQQHTRKGAQNGDSNKKVILLFGNAGPMATQLPRYLSAAVSKKLRQCGIEVEDRSIARYVSMESSRGKASRLALYTEKSYDHLDSRKITTDLVILAPSVDGNNGTAVIPTYYSLGSSYKQDNQQRYLPWSSLISPPRVTCYLDDGRIATNSEYQAASNIYAAGSVTRSPNARNGRADVAGGNSTSSARIGEIAARNMVRDHVSTESRDKYSSRMDSIPVWRSDVVPYLPKANGSLINDPTEQTSKSSLNESYALYSMGIHALCVGRCDSDTLATHGFWWTNTNQQSNNDEKNNSSSSDSTRGRRMNTSAFMRRITRKTTSKVGHKSRSRGGSLPVYGSGVIYYLDRMGSICGIMLWGLPFSQVPQDVKSGINHPLVERMKHMISSNGAVAIKKHSMKIADNYPGLNVDLNLLSYLHLVEESKLLASMAMSGFNNDEAVEIFTLGKPLHRYTPIKSHELSSLGKLRRREMGYPAEADDLYYPVEIISSSSEEEYTRPPSLKRIYPMNGGATTTSIEKEMEMRQLQIDRSRPPKEEPLWIRKGEEQKFVNYRETMDHSFYHNIQQGKFIDGTDAVKQAPVPEAYLEAKEQFKSWAGKSTSSHQSGEEGDGI